MLAPDRYLHAVLNQRYRLEEFVGRHQTGQVYRGVRIAEGTPPLPVCVRLFPPDDPARRAIVHMFDEVVDLSVPGLLPWIEIGHATTGPASKHTYLIAPWGEPLSARLARSPLTPSEVLPLVLALATALSELHQLDLVYLKLRPSNVVWQDGQWFLADRDSLGRVDVASVEQFLAHADIGTVALDLWRQERTPAADMWALGMLVLACLGVKLPQVGSGLTYDTMMGRHLAPAGLPAPWDLVVRGCLMPEPPRRWTADNVLDAIHGRPVLVDTSWRPRFASDPASASPEGRKLEGHLGEVRTCAFSPSEDVLASGSHDGSVHLWDIHTGRFRRLAGHAAPVRRVVFANDGHRLYSADREGEVRLWDIAGGKTLHQARLSGPIADMSLRPQGGVLLLQDDGSLWCWDGDLTTSGQVEQALCLLATEQGHAWGRLDGQVLTQTSRLARHRGPVAALVTTASGIGSAGFDGRACSFEAPTELWCMACRDGWTVAGGQDRLVYAWAPDGREMQFRGHTLGVTAVSISRDGTLLASASRDRRLMLWEVS